MLWIESMAWALPVAWLVNAFLFPTGGSGLTLLVYVVIVWLIYRHLKRSAGC